MKSERERGANPGCAFSRLFSESRRSLSPRSPPAPLLPQPRQDPRVCRERLVPAAPSHTHSLREDLFQVLHSHTVDPFLSRASQQLKSLKPSNVLNNTAQELEANVKSEGAVHTYVHTVLLGEIF